MAVLRALFLTALALCLAMPALAREVQVLVTDKDLELPLEGVRLSLPDGRVLLTDADGRLVLELPDGPGVLRLKFNLIGYEPGVWLLQPDQKSVNLALGIAGVVEGSELVVEVAKPQTTDAQTGVSRVATREDLKDTAEMGVMEDLMSTIKTLPGVGFNSGFNARPIIDGGGPNEMAATLDGALVAWPYQWGGVLSIFDPNMIASAKLSKGYVSPRYGQLISGLLEVASRTPESGQPQLDASLSTTGLDLFSLVPLGENAGFLLGGKVTWISLIFPILPLPIDFTTAPYITNGYGHLWLKPGPAAQWDLSAFVGNDGVGLSTTTSKEQLTSSREYGLDNPYVLLSTRLKALLDPTLLLDGTISWNHLFQDDHSISTTNGSVAYSPDFMILYAPLLHGASSYAVDHLQSSTHTTQVSDLLQGKLHLDGQPSPEQGFNGGVEISWQNLDWSRSATSTAKVTTTQDYPHSRELNSAAYLGWQGSFLDRALELEAGLRLDHSFLYNDSLILNTLPVVNPRLRLVLTPLRDQETISLLSVSLGTGLYSQLGLDGSFFDPAYGAKNFDLAPDRAWSSQLGLELQTPEGWKFSVEGYGKYYFARQFVTTDPGPVGTTTPATVRFRVDGSGWSWGIDAMVQHQFDRWWNGYLTYSYNNTRLFNPSAAGDSALVRSNKGPLDLWFYPGYQRFHVLNLVSVWKPLDGFSLMVKGSLASGTPRPEYGPITSYPSVVDGQVIERYTRTSAYSDSLRTEISCPVDIKLSWQGYFAASKLAWEAYVAAQDVFVTLYLPKTGDSYDSYTGASTIQTASFNIGFPLPSIGLKLNF